MNGIRISIPSKVAITLWLMARSKLNGIDRDMFQRLGCFEKIQSGDVTGYFGSRGAVQGVTRNASERRVEELGGNKN
jgi:hypothetical protein